MTRTMQDLRPAQRRTIEELKSSLGVQAVLGMGAGKTAAALFAFKELKDAGHVRAMIVAAPRRVALKTWPDEIKLWEELQDLDMAILGGSPAQRFRKLREKHDVYVIGIDNIVWLLEEGLKGFGKSSPLRDLLCIDELSRFKGPTGERAKAVVEQAGQFKAIWGLTGTPHPNQLSDQWMPLKIVSAGEAFGPDDFEMWKRKTHWQVDFNGYEWKMHDWIKPKIMEEINVWSFTIPPEEATDVPFNWGEGYDVTVPLTAAQIEDLKTLDKELLLELGREGTSLEDMLSGDPDEDLVVALSKAVASGKMSQVLQGFVYREGETVQSYTALEKMAALKDLIDGADSEPVLVCYNYKQDLDHLRRTYGRDLQALGDGLSDRRTNALIDAWNRGEVPILPLHPASAGHGLNLQFGGRRMIWYANTWSAEQFAQTCKRIARPGQKLPVYVHRIMADHWLERLHARRVEGKLKEEKEFISMLRRV